MIYTCGSTCVRMDILKDAVGDPVRVAGQPRDTTTARKNNGITGDARRSSKELGERLFKMRVEYGTRQINRMLTSKEKSGSR
jgi:creatinine amidohydrolase